jgi:hypothetical protein
MAVIPHFRVKLTVIEAETFWVAVSVNVYSFEPVGLLVSEGVTPLTTILPPLPEGLFVMKLKLGEIVNAGLLTHEGFFVTEYAMFMGSVSMPSLKVDVIGEV